ncbi:IPT/TIG domain-containing protein [Flavitalea sp. BT771]|uniref:IPT/TIG domain-containing protein n=1 Tax=Flavitalea sp. BT771 TaxID=3063329 RepID=UPI0026E23B09|nr:IPT/TIG domain-containing protein [Flavitalea sp. BT771]MDO6432954.1 IPT/TIG domain-containing protein [Flavitalea sp. BT771]MDV6221770.1 IPT/TIG domain-containing protein [Flavitalea sp. BT771]
MRNCFIILLAGLPGFVCSCRKTTDPPEDKVLKITAFSPDSGAGGAVVQISGSGFSSIVPENKVSFNGKPAIVMAASPTSLAVKVPMTAGDGKIFVQTGAASVRSFTDFSYVYTVSTLAGGDAAGFAEGKGADARFSGPVGVAVDGIGNVYVADNGNNRIRKIQPDGTVTTLAGDGSAALLNGPGSLALDATGDLYVSGDGINGVEKVTPDGAISILAGVQNGGYKEGRGPEALFNGVLGIAIDKYGNVYAADLGNNVIRKINPLGVTTAFAGNHVSGYVDTYSTDAEFSGPIGLAVDAAGNVYTTEINNKRIRKIDPGGLVSSVAGNGQFGTADGVGAGARFDFVPALATDAAGNVYAADRFNCNIRKITPAGVVTTIAGGTSRARAFADGAGPDARFNNPAGIAVDGSGVIYVADVMNNRIRKLQ